MILKDNLRTSLNTYCLVAPPKSYKSSSGKSALKTPHPETSSAIALICYNRRKNQGAYAPTATNNRHACTHRRSK